MEAATPQGLLDSTPRPKRLRIVESAGVGRGRVLLCCFYCQLPQEKRTWEPAWDPAC